MSKQMSRVTGVVAATLFAVAVMLFAVAAGSPAQSQKPAKAQPTPKPNSGEFHSWRFETVFTTKMVVGSCNTTQGCKALKNVCETLPKHDFATNEAGSVGVCADTSRKSSTGAWFLRNSNSPGDTSNEDKNTVGIDIRPGNNQAQGKRRYAPVVILKRIDKSTPSLNCEGAAICRKVQSTCPTLGGTYKRISDVAGSCGH
ncbi:MAG: hypothetical protein WAM70_10630 [Pyrinomonadaceae bacterium]